MKLSIHTGGGLPYARKEPYEYDGHQYDADLQNGDIVKILDSGETEQGNFGEQTVFKIKTRNGDKKFTMNQSTINVLVQEFGEETENWINQDVKVLLQKRIITGKKCVVAYLVTADFEFDEYGELVKVNQIEGEAEQSLEVQSPVSSPINKPLTVDDIPF